jgi:hypothetical protein
MILDVISIFYIMNCSHILILRGILYSKVSTQDDIFADRINEMCEEEGEFEVEEVHYGKIPGIFIDKEHWIQRTNLRCWHCDAQFDNMPWFIPTMIRTNDAGQEEISVLGNTCCKHCTAAQIHERNKGNKEEIDRLMNNLYILNEKMTGIFTVMIKSSPERTCMIEYRGVGPTRAQYNKILESLDNTFSIDETQNNIVFTVPSDFISCAEDEEDFD